MTMSPKNRHSFEVAFESFRKQLWLFILHKVPPQEADDLFQTICLQAFKAFQSMDDKSKLKAMAFTIARRRIQDYYRGKATASDWDGKVTISDLAQNEPFSPEQRLLLQAIPEMIRGLQEPYREVATMHFLLGLTGHEIADILDENHNTIKSQIRRGKLMLFKMNQVAHGARHETK